MTKRKFVHITLHLVRPCNDDLPPGLYTIAICLLALFPGCNFTSQSYNHGKLLSPGESIVTLGGGTRQFYLIDAESSRLTSTVYDTIGSEVFPRTVSSIDTVIDTTIGLHWSTGLSFRLGTLEKKPFGNGLEIGFLLEYPAQFALHHGFPVIEFDARAGLPSKKIAAGLYNHNIGAGWTLGAWVDNGWYLEYAAGIEYKKCIPYAGLRGMLVATDITTDSLDLRSEYLLTKHAISWNVRTAIGISVRLPRIIALPDFIAPEMCIIYPDYSNLRKIGVTGHVGLRWQNGF